MHNPLEKFTRRQEEKVPVDRAFLNRLETDLFPEPRTRSKWWKFSIVLPMAVTALLIVSLVYGPLSPDDDIPVVNATTLLELFTPDTDDQLRRITLEQKSIRDDEKTFIDTTEYWMQGQSVRTENYQYENTFDHLSRHSSSLFSAQEAQRCSHTIFDKKDGAHGPGCTPISLNGLHAGMLEPTHRLDIQQAVRGPDRDNFPSFFVEWTTKRPIDKLTIRNAAVVGTQVSVGGDVGGGKDSRDAATYENVQRNGLYHHRARISATNIFELEEITFQITPSIGGKLQSSQILHFNFETEALTEISYEEVRSYPIYDLYQRHFRIPLYIVEHEEDFQGFTTTEFVERDGQKLTYVRYDIPEVHHEQMQSVFGRKQDIGSVHFWYLPYEKQLVEYQVWDKQNTVLLQTKVLTDEVLEEDSAQLLSVEGWLKEQIK